MKNSQYQEGALRVIVSEGGKQFLATPEGVKFPMQKWTVLTQGVNEALAGVCLAECELYVKEEGENMDDKVEIDGLGIRYNGNTYHISFINDMGRVDDVSERTVVIKCLAYPDATT